MLNYQYASKKISMEIRISLLFCKIMDNSFSEVTAIEEKEARYGYRLLAKEMEYNIYNVQCCRSF
jgi:hypothetical protein